MKSHLLIISLFAVSIIYSMSSCADKLPEPTLDCTSIATIKYTDHIQSILNAECNLSGCHDDNGLSSFGNFSTLGTRAQSIYSRVVVNQNMPPAGMSSDLVDSIRCWKEGGYTE